MKPSPTAATPVRSILFSRELAGQCPAGGSGVFDWMVCDTVANGSRRLAEGLGPAGGPLTCFERALPPSFGVEGLFCVIGELSGDTCLALSLGPAAAPKKLAPPTLF